MTTTLFRPADRLCAGVPVRNLFPAHHDDADCGGLLDDLAQAGFRVAPVK
jgi:hypothetical protein